MKITVFYSWQSDLPNSTNRGFILTALERAAKAIYSDESITVEPVVDRDTSGVPGSPNIAATILSKIESSEIFVCDVSIINPKRIGSSRPTPNPNVLIELGYAINELGNERIILILNKAYGNPEELPFDLRMNRVVVYEMAESNSDKASERNRLQHSLETAIRQILETTSLVLSITQSLLIKLSTINPVRVFSSYGMIHYLGGPCPPLEGTTDLQITVENLSKYPAKFIKVDLEIRLVTKSRPNCARTIEIPSTGWSELASDRRFWHFRYDGELNDVCLGNDSLPLGLIRFYFAMGKDSQDFRAIEEEEYTSLEASVLTDSISKAIGGGHYHQTYQERICRIYGRNPAEDTFIIRCSIRAENFPSTLTEFEFKVLWSDSDIPNLVSSENEATIFDFHIYKDRSSIPELRTALLEKIPIGSDAETILDFLDENNMPSGSDSNNHIGITNVLDTHNAICLMLRVRNSHRRQVINFLFDEGRNLKDITVEFHP